jgi:protein-L-isoaspartate O-methyltransferase
MVVAWERHAEELARRVTHDTSRWRAAVAATPRHEFVPRWFVRVADGPKWHWELRNGPDDEQKWIAAAYEDRTLITRVGASHADLATEMLLPPSRPTSSSTLPTLVVDMFRFARIEDRHEVLEVGTGTAYSTAVLSSRLRDRQVTSVDVEPHLTAIGRERLDQVGLHPRLVTADATVELPGEYDRIVAMVSVASIPPGWLQALRPGGRLVVVIADTSLVISADKTADGGAAGRVEPYLASFMSTRSGSDYPDRQLTQVRDRDDGDTSEGRYPVADVANTWELRSMLELALPGTEHDFELSNDGRKTARMWHPDGSWARASAVGFERPTVWQGGPRRLWDALDGIRERWLVSCQFPIREAKVRITPDGVCELSRGSWQATIG